jgi:hypothetical protein
MIHHDIAHRAPMAESNAAAAGRKGKGTPRTVLLAARDRVAGFGDDRKWPLQSVGGGPPRTIETTGRFDVTPLASGLIALLWLAAAAPATSDEAPAPATAAATATEGDGRVGLSISTAYAWRTLPVFGGARDEPRSVLAVDVRLHRRLLARRNLLVDYTLGVVPAELEGGTVVSDPVLGERKKRIYGAGFDPVGVFVLSGAGSRRLFASFRGGIRLFADRVPNSRGTRFDFSADFAVGLAQRIGSRAWLTAGPEFHHISNGGLGEFNPSLNNVAARLGVLVVSR